MTVAQLPLQLCDQAVLCTALPSMCEQFPLSPVAQIVFTPLVLPSLRTRYIAVPDKPPGIGLSKNVLNVVDEFFVNSDNPPVTDAVAFRPSRGKPFSPRSLQLNVFCERAVPHHWILMVFFLHVFASVWSVIFVLCLLATPFARFLARGFLQHPRFVSSTCLLLVCCELYFNLL